MGSSDPLQPIIFSRGGHLGDTSPVWPRPLASLLYIGYLTSLILLHIYSVHLFVKNIPYSQSSAKLPATQSLSHSVTRSISHLVTRSLSHFVTWSLGHLVNQSLGHLVTWSLGHLVTWSLGHLVTGHLVTWSLGHLVTRSLGHLITWSLGHLVTMSLGHYVILSFCFNNATQLTN